MKRMAAGLVSVIAILGASQAVAGNPYGDDENDYEGTVENIKGTYFGFDLNDSKTRVKGITAYVGFQCENDDLVYALVEANGSLRVNDADQGFSGRVERVVNQNFRIEYRVDGKLLTQGRARGTLKGKYEDPDYETPCRTGEVEWRAKKGADVEVR